MFSIVRKFKRTDFVSVNMYNKFKNIRNKFLDILDKLKYLMSIRILIISKIRFSVVIFPLGFLFQSIITPRISSTILALIYGSMIIFLYLIVLTQLMNYTIIPDKNDVNELDTRGKLRNQNIFRFYNTLIYEYIIISIIMILTFSIVYYRNSLLYEPTNQLKTLNESTLNLINCFKSKNKVEKIYEKFAEDFANYSLLVIKRSDNFPNEVDKQEFITALYFSTITFTTLGYGDVLPANNIGKIITMTEVLIGTIHMVAFVSMIITSFSDKKQYIELMDSDENIQRVVTQMFFSSIFNMNNSNSRYDTDSHTQK